jgi:hypothetical protein
MARLRYYLSWAINGIVWGGVSCLPINKFGRAGWEPIGL